MTKTNAKLRLLGFSLLGMLVACAGEGGDPDPASGIGDDPDGEARAGAGDAAAAQGPDGAKRTAARPRSVTLITGDRVVVHGVGGGARLAIAPARGRTGVRFHMYTEREHRHVVPEDAAALIAGGRIDPRLFDVTLLVELGYDEARRADIPLIVIRDENRRAAADALLADARVRGGRPLPTVRGAAVAVPSQHAAELWASLMRPAAGRRGVAPALADGIERIWLDGKREPLLDRSVPQIGGPAAWEAGYTGEGVTVAVLDTGIALDHADFEGRIAGATSFLDDHPDAMDDVGHGTHVASILAGSGAASGGTYRGVAPDAQLLVGKVCGLDGCPESAILAGMEWAAQSGATVVNLSLGGRDSPEIDPLEEAINTLSAEHGTLFVVAAGNFPSCSLSGQVGSPSTADAALSVGSVDSADQLSWFSCVGPRLGDGAVKPEITAPGEAIVAARAAGTPDGDLEPVDDFYARLSGTSMATPHAAGAAALLAQQHPDWSGEQLKSALMASARPTAGWSVFEQGAGRVDLERGIAQTVLSSPASLSLGRPLWPHEDDEPTSVAVTYHNDGDEAVTLALTLDVTDPSGGPPPPGLFSITPESVTIPAGGDAQVVVAADTRVAGPDGLYSGALVGSAAGAAVRTPLGLDKEVESYDLELDFRHREQPPAPGAWITADVIALDTDDRVDVIDVDDSITLRLRPGRYTVHASVFESQSATMIAQPLLELTADTALVVDAPAAQPISMTVPDPTADRAYETVLGEVPGRGGTGMVTFSEEEGSLFTLHVGPSLPPSDYVTVVAAQWAEEGPPDNWLPFADSPFAYNLGYVAARGEFITGFTRHPGPDDLARVRQDFAAQGAGFTGDTLVFGESTDGQAFIDPLMFLSHRLPATRIDYFSTEETAWAGLLSEVDADGANTGFLSSVAVAYEAGKRYRERWNQGVLGPSFVGGQWVVRFEDEIAFDFLPLYADKADHYGSAPTQTGHARLFRDGSLIGESDVPDFGFFAVPPEPGDYRIEIQSIRGGLSQLSTQVDVAWTFRSEHAEEGEIVSLPVMAVRFAPALDELNRAPAGRPFLIPISIARQFDAPAAPLRRFRVEASFDGGATWKRAIVLRFGDQAIALVFHPDGEGTVSLRATASDRDGNEVEQSIRDAYRLRAP